MKLNFQVKLSRRLWFPKELEKLDTKVTQKVFSNNFFLGEIRKKFKHFQSDFIVDIFNHEHIKDHPSVAKIVHIKIIDFAGKLRCFF